MIKDAEKFADDDKKLKERVESRNELESYAYSLKNQIADKDKLGAKVSCLLHSPQVSAGRTRFCWEVKNASSF